MPFVEVNIEVYPWEMSIQMGNNTILHGVAMLTAMVTSCVNITNWFHITWKLFDQWCAEKLQWGMIIEIVGRLSPERYKLFIIIFHLHSCFFVHFAKIFTQSLKLEENVRCSTRQNSGNSMVILNKILSNMLKIREIILLCRYTKCISLDGNWYRYSLWDFYRTYFCKVVCFGDTEPIKLIPVIYIS